MIMDIMTNKLFIAGFVLVLIAITYNLLNRKDNNLEQLEAEYEEVLNSDKYKVKGQYSSWIYLESLKYYTTSAGLSWIN